MSCAVTLTCFCWQLLCLRRPLQPQSAPGEECALTLTLRTPHAHASARGPHLQEQLVPTSKVWLSGPLSTLSPSSGLYQLSPGTYGHLPPSPPWLTQAVFEAEPDVLVCQAPRMRGLPPPLVELLYAAKTSFLIW